MHTAELFAGPEDGRSFTVPGPARPEIRVPDTRGVWAALGGHIDYAEIDGRPVPVTAPPRIPAHIYRWAGSRGQRAVYRYERTE